MRTFPTRSCMEPGKVQTFLTLVERAREDVSEGNLDIMNPTA